MKQISFFGRSSVSAALALTNGRPSADRRVRYGMYSDSDSSAGVPSAVGMPSVCRRCTFGLGSVSKWCRIAAVWLLLLTLGVGQAWGATKTEGFETATVATSYNSTATITTIKSDCSIAWSIYYGNVSSTGKITGNNSCLMRWYSSSSSKLGYARTTTPIKGLSNVTFNAKVTSAGHKMGVWYSTNGENWTALATNVTLATTPASISYDIPNSSTSTDYYIKIGITEATADKKDLIIDDVVFTYSTATSYTITASSSNNSHGTVSVSGTTITATPANCYQVVSGDGGYTLNSGNASITHTGTDNTLIVTPTSNCSITVNFERKATNTYIDEIQDNGTQELCDAEAPALDDKTAATTGTCAQQHYHFAGWVTEANKANPTPANTITAGTTIAVNGTTYYAVWAKQGTGGTSYIKATSVSEGVYVMVSESTASAYRYMPNTTSSGSNPNLGLGISISTTAGVTKLSNSIADAMLWDFTSTGTANQYYIRPHGSTAIGLGCTASTGANIRISSTYKNVGWTITSNNSYGWQFKSNAATAMYLAVYDDSNWRNYTAEGTNQNGKFHLFKQTASYSDSITSCCESLGEIKGSVDSTQ